MGKKLVWKTRPVERCAQFPQGIPVEHYEVEVEDHEWDFLAREAQQMRKHEPGSQAYREHFNVIATTMEMKCLLGARMLTAAEAAALAPDSTEDEQAAITETLATMRRLRERGLSIPDSVMQKMEAGQTSLFDSPPPEPSPGRSDASSPPEVSGVAPERREAPEPPPEPAPPAPEPVPPEPEPSPVGTPGVYGGRVPAFTLPEAIETFAAWRADEFGRLKVRVLLLAHEHGEYHSEMLVGMKLSNRNLIGAVTNVLASKDLMEQKNKRGEVETRISSTTSRRRSFVWRLTPAGALMAADMAKVEAVVAWAFWEEDE